MNTDKTMKNRQDTCGLGAIVRLFSNVCFFVILGGSSLMNASMPAAEINDVVLVVHGGTARGRETLTPEREAEKRKVMAASLQAGYDALQKPEATSLDGVVAAVKVLEDSPLFNAGRGAVFTADERNELDASIMDGRNLAAGAVAGVTIVKNPITAARAVMERTEHVLLMGHGAEEFCRDQKLEIVDPSYFRTDEQLEELHKQQAEEKEAAKKQASAVTPGGASPQGIAPSDPDRTYGTVGAVALDRNGHVAAGTSTGGMTNKRHGRVGDSPIIGAGTYADDRSCGISCTGHGEYFIRYSVAHSVASLVRYKGYDIQQAATEVVEKDLGPAGGVGGVIVLDPKGRAAFAWNTPGMWHGYITRDGKITVNVYDR
jgi:beta-aspartyl-peptidase (threonine type)